MRPPKPFNRGGIWYLIRRVPKKYRHLDTRSFVYLTTRIPVVDDPRGIRAAQVVAHLNEVLEQGWRELEQGREPNHEERYERARRTAHQLGIRYIEKSELAQAGPIEIKKRVALIKRFKPKPSSAVYDAVVGVVSPPPLTLSRLVAAFEKERAASLKALSPDQLKRWRNPKNRAVNDLIKIVGDKNVTALTRADALAFRDHWRERVINGKAEIGTANKQFGHIGKMLRTLENAQQIGIPLDVFAKLRLEGEKTVPRAPFDPEFIQEVILADGALDALHPEARRVVFVMANTGLRPSEIVNLRPSHIHLDADVPHLEIKPEGRKLKTNDSERVMPLMGCALEAMKLQPKGFPRYFDKGATLSANINKFFRNHGMRPTPAHSLYSLRHSFEDRLTALDPPDKIIATLMGHKHQRPKYGKGPTLEHLQGWLDRIAFAPPTSL
ncbi:Integrase [Candidatus Filomicrobium marinum]|uniref:Integrase n=1 Tax=Candidatus Filomicrobium marinum TaxID=1608628 RepID=A0A0D6JH16_9HYPH|nr:tyrosine-type recombinase/integrase [Candidatus Filomicrobium marinum]CFX45838.1 Integrase [Candidatus Filomicrobium marinum]CPR20721.1 Integrase [Candidatus Filomicrobium marinum]